MKNTKDKLLKFIDGLDNEALEKLFSNIVGKKEFDYHDIKTFEDACEKLGIDEDELPDTSNIPERFRNANRAHYELMVIYEAINNGWTPDWNNTNQAKYYPYFRLSSGFGFSATAFSFGSAYSVVGSRLCTDSSDKAIYIAKTFEKQYKNLFLQK